MKIAIVRNHKYQMPDGKCLLEAHRTNLLFKIFGPSVFTWIASGYDKDNLIRETKDKLFGKMYIHEEMEI